MYARDADTLEPLPSFKVGEKGKWQARYDAKAIDVSAGGRTWHRVTPCL